MCQVQRALRKRRASMDQLARGPGTADARHERAGRAGWNGPGGRRRASRLIEEQFETCAFTPAAQGRTGAAQRATNRRNRERQAEGGATGCFEVRGLPRRRRRQAHEAAAEAGRASKPAATKSATPKARSTGREAGRTKPVAPKAARGQAGRQPSPSRRRPSRRRRPGGRPQRRRRGRQAEGSGAKAGRTKPKAATAKPAAKPSPRAPKDRSCKPAPATKPKAAATKPAAKPVAPKAAATAGNASRRGQPPHRLFQDEFGSLSPATAGADARSRDPGGAERLSP